MFFLSIFFIAFACMLAYGICYVANKISVKLYSIAYQCKIQAPVRIDSYETPAAFLNNFRCSSVHVNRILHSWSFNTIMEFMKLVGLFWYFARQGLQNIEINQLIS